MFIRDFPRPDLGPNNDPFKIKTSQMSYIVLNFLGLHFGENFVKIRSKIPKLQMHDKLHKM